MSNNIGDLDKRLLGLFTAACAPLSSQTLVNDIADLEPSDYTVETSIDEIRFLKHFAHGGLSAIVDALDTIPHEMIEEQEDGSSITQSAEISVALLSAASFAARVAFVANQVHHICMHSVDRFAVDPTDLIKDLEHRAKDGERPTGELGESLSRILDFTPNAKWAPMESPLKNRVGFKETAAVISEGIVKEEALKVPDVRRRNQRNPTGYHKFNFKDLALEDSDFDGEGRSRASSTRAGSTDDSTRGSISVAGTTHGALTSRSVSSAPEETDYIDDELIHGGKSPFELRGRSSSAVAFQSEKVRQVIQDSVADPQWEEARRHNMRFSRIRNRVPTGHPSLMKGHSGELESIIGEFERSFSIIQLDNQTGVNTEANKTTRTFPTDTTTRPSGLSSVGNRNVTLPKDD